MFVNTYPISVKVPSFVIISWSMPCPSFGKPSAKVSHNWVKQPLELNSCSKNPKVEFKVVNCVVLVEFDCFRVQTFLLIACLSSTKLIQWSLKWCKVHLKSNFEPSNFEKIDFWQLCVQKWILDQCTLYYQPKIPYNCTKIRLLKM